MKNDSSIILPFFTPSTSNVQILDNLTLEMQPESSSDVDFYIFTSDE